MLTVEYADNVLRVGPLFFKKRAKTSKQSFVGQLVTCVNMGSNQPHLTQKVSQNYLFFLGTFFSALARWHSVQLLRIISVRSYRQFSRNSIFVGP